MSIFNAATFKVRGKSVPAVYFRGVNLLGGGGPSYTLPEFTLLDLCASLADHTFSSNTTTALYDAAGPGEGKIRLTGNGTNATLYARHTTTESYVPQFGAVAWMVNRIGGGVNGVQAALYRGGSSGTVSFGDSVTSYRAGRRWFSANGSEFGSFASGSYGTVMSQMSVNQKSPYDADAVVGPMYFGADGRPTLVFTFDDCRIEQYTQVLPLFAARGMKATVYAVKNFTGMDGNRMTLANLQALYAAGWDIGSNTTADGPITGFANDSACVADLQAAKDWLTTNGMPRAVDHMALSNGSWNEARVAALEAAGMKTARTTVGQTMYSRFGFGDQAMTLPGQSLEGQTLAALKGMVDLAVLRGATYMFYSHVPDMTILAGLLDYVKNAADYGLLDVLTVSQWWNRDHNKGAPV